MIVRWLAIFCSTLFKNANGLRDIWIDTIAIVIYVELIVIGTRVKDKMPI